MTVESITMEELSARNECRYQQDEYAVMSGVFITNESLVNVTSKTWKFIRDELNALPNLKYCCQYEKLDGVHGKRMWFVSETAILGAKVCAFLEGAIVHKSTVSAACIMKTSCTRVHHVQLEEGANCPLFQ